jgi:hypothetical protein
MGSKSRASFPMCTRIEPLGDTKRYHLFTYHVIEPPKLMRDTDPVADLWLHAMRAEIDALVLRFEAQLKQHIANSNAVRAQDHATLQAAVTSAQNALKDHQRTADSLAMRLAERDQEIATLRSSVDTLRRERDEAVTAVTTLRADVTSLGARVQSLDEQFVHEKSFVAAVLSATNTGIFEATQTSAGVAIEHSPQCYGAIKARKAEAILALAMRERGRTVARIHLTQDERIALGAMADAAGCQLIDVQIGQRFSSTTMEKAATRVEPADEDHVLECLMPGLRMAETTGAVVHPRVVVATGLDHTIPSFIHFPNPLITRRNQYRPCGAQRFESNAPVSSKP